MINALKKIGLKLLLVFISITLVLEHLAADRPALVFLAAALGISRWLASPSKSRSLSHGDAWRTAQRYFGNARS